MNQPTDYQKLTPELIDLLTAIVGRKNILVDEGKENYARDESPLATTFMPEAVVKPQNAGQISEILKLAGRHIVPVTPRGAGTGIAAGSLPVFGGITLSLERLNRVLEIDPANFSATAEAGVTLQDFCRAIEEKGLYFPLYPGETSSFIGGNAATNAGGMRAVKYGVARNLVLGLEAVLPTGEIIRTGGKYIKCSTGYDLTQLIVGSEGTLAVITEVTVKLITTPANREILFIPFNSLSDAIACVPAILREGILPVGIEFMEEDILRMVEQLTGRDIPMLGYSAYLMLILESESYDAFCVLAERIGDICLKLGAADIFVPNSESAKRNLLEAREKFQPAFKKNGMLETIDAVVPRSQIAVFINKVREIGNKYGIRIVGSGHAGDGNVHLHPLGTEADMPVMKDLLTDIYRAAIEMGGTLSGEHGLGYDKREYLRLAASPEKIDLMKRIKKAFDPHNILNPGKVLPD
ncbi:MAG: FAD-binding protein [Dehalococcoidales bacterium]|nr:FAD-binding protein [Dehalococcoidales bacterium]